ncbi:MAG: phage holin family protein [Gluconacetobacter diazotrophicus]|nr:phage holin family protein [Gluconacetobacter diazotrophicus]
MKAVELARVAASAEALRLRRQLTRYGRQAAFLVVAAVFALFALVFLHVILWNLCAHPWHLGPVWASVLVFGVDLLFALLLLLLGRGRGIDAVEVEARITRDRSLSELRSALAFSAVAATATGPIGRLAGRTAWGSVRRLIFRRRR